MVNNISDIPHPKFIFEEDGIKKFIILVVNNDINEDERKVILSRTIWIKPAVSSFLLQMGRYHQHNTLNIRLLQLDTSTPSLLTDTGSMKTIVPDAIEMALKNLNIDKRMFESRAIKEFDWALSSYGKLLARTMADSEEEKMSVELT